MKFIIKSVMSLAVICMCLASTQKVFAGVSVDIDGKKYTCSEGTEGSTCWNKCPWGFDSCFASCGAGESCWNKCPWGFDSCTKCGEGDACWKKCPWGFDSCAQACGKNHAPSREQFERDQLETKLMLEAGAKQFNK